MKKTADIVNRENEFKGLCNKDRYDLNRFIYKVRHITGEELPNIVSIYRDKIWEFEVFFEEKGIYFFDDNCYLRIIVMRYLEGLEIQCYKDYIIYASLLTRMFFFKRVFKKLLNDTLNNMYAKVKLIREFHVEDLPKLFEESIECKNFYSPLLPDTCSKFTTKCLEELKVLGFDLLRSVDMLKVINDCKELEEYSTGLIEKSGLDERIKVFNKFKEDMKINLSSDLVLAQECNEKQPQL